MPSFRVIMTIGALAAGTAPQSVVPTAAAAAATLTTVEAADLAVVSGSARVTIRFTGEDDTALAIARRTVEGTRAVAEVVSFLVTRRDGGRWYPVAPR
ncbi:MAG TPA: hypothetical protein VGC18_01885 [Lacisediminihabitans sp.]|uniref:hypothetical protein n=1 Tax=Lacisediminihabitans sp. TaxID=2787631 RepID=UPI002ED9B069